MNTHGMKIELLLHSLVFKLAQADDDEEREMLLEIIDSALEARQEFLDDLKRMDENEKLGRRIFKPREPLSDEEKAQRLLERKQRNARWN